jgi:protease-4
MAQELRLAVEDIRSKGKKTIGVVDDDSQASYLVAAACDEVVMPPSNSLMIYGVKADAYFLRGLLQKVGVTAEIIHIGKYKSYGEMFTEDDFTTPARENMTEIVDDMYAQMVGSIAASRKLSKEDVEAAINRGPATPEEAKAAKLVDRVAYADEVVAELAKSGLAIVAGEDYAKDSRDKPDEVNLFSLIAMMSRQQSGGEKDSKYPLVAVVYAVGPIMPGSSGGFELGSSEEIAADDFIKTLDEIQKDKKVKAVVLRVNSPGGSAFASDLIWRKVVELRKVKPVVASMGDVAASGGYYIAMGASKIIAHEGTLTGSIGVVGGKMNLSGGFDKLGIRKTTISRGDFATLFSETSGFSAVERGLVEKMMHKTYDDFVAKAAEGRGVSREKLKEVAQGRVWSGARAKEAGLVDEIGGMGKAVAEVKALLGMKPDEKVSLLMYPKEVSLFELLQKAMGGNVTAQLGMPALEAAAPAQLRGVLETARAMARLMRREAVLTIMPFVPVIN